MDAAVQTARRPPPPPPEIVVKLQWLMFFRVAIVTLLLGSSLVLRVVGADFAANPVQLTLLGVIISTYAVTIIYALVLRTLRSGFERFAYAQLVIDLVFGAALISVTGGTESLFLILYALTVLAASIILYRRGAMYMMALSTGLVVFQVAREALGWWQPGGPVDDDALLGTFLSGVTNISAVFLVALLAGYLSEQVRESGRRLRVASRDLEEARALNEHIITSIQSGLVSYTLDGQVIFFNPAAARITGLDPEAVLYESVGQVFPAGARSDDTDRWEAVHARPDGKRRVLGFSRSPLLDGEGLRRGFILAFQDLTPLRDMEAGLRRSERLAAIGKMAAGIAHEIRNPLASMSGSIQMLGDRVELDAMGERLMGIVVRETDRLNTLITDFLQFARPNPPQLETIDLADLLDELVQVFGYLHQPGDPAASTESPSVQLDIEGSLVCRADPRQLKQVFWNLLNNAKQAMPAGGRVLVRGRRDGSSLAVEVIDTGDGIPADALERIFDPFYSTKEQGTGLGLAQVLRIVEEHAGTIDVDSTPSKGSAFTVRLPADGPVTATSPPAEAHQ